MVVVFSLGSSSFFYALLLWLLNLLIVIIPPQVHRPWDHKEFDAKKEELGTWKMLDENICYLIN